MNKGGIDPDLDTWIVPGQVLKGTVLPSPGSGKEEEKKVAACVCAVRYNPV